jgi:DNA-binding NarL/FixJ family response regulator
MKKKLNKVIICDEHLLYRTGLRVILSSNKEIDVSAVASNFVQLLSLLLYSKPDVILISMNMIEEDKGHVLNKIRKMYPMIRFIVLTAEEDNAYAKWLKEHGIDHFLPRNAEPAAFYKIICTTQEEQYGLTA